LKPPSYIKSNKEAQLIFEDGNKNQTYKKFKIRPGGNRCLRAVKRSLVIKLKKKQGRLLGHYRRFTLKAMWTDPSLLREWATWKACSDL